MKTSAEFLRKRKQKKTCEVLFFH